MIRALLLLWFAGVALRLTILSVPPVIPLIHNDLHLSETQVGVLSGLPMVLFAGAAIAGSLLVARLGALTTLIAGLALCAVGSALRGVGPSIAMLYFGTVVTAFGVAGCDQALLPMYRKWEAQRQLNVRIFCIDGVGANTPEQVDRALPRIAIASRASPSCPKAGGSSPA